MNKVDTIIQELELDMIEFSVPEKGRLSKLPLMTDHEIKALIWNMLTGDKTRKKISYNDYSKIMDIFIKRYENI